jgi:hypothetical protein
LFGFVGGGFCVWCGVVCGCVLCCGFVCGCMVVFVLWWFVDVGLCFVVWLLFLLGGCGLLCGLCCVLFLVCSFWCGWYCVGVVVWLGVVLVDGVLFVWVWC